MTEKQKERLASLTGRVRSVRTQRDRHLESIRRAANHFTEEMWETLPDAVRSAFSAHRGRGGKA